VVSHHTEGWIELLFWYSGVDIAVVYVKPRFGIISERIFVFT
jgi:hypothetical protein